MRAIIAWLDRHPGVALVAAVLLGLAAQTAYIAWRYDGSAAAARARWATRERETQSDHRETVEAVTALRNFIAAKH